jgi:hypothetical protein
MLKEKSSLKKSAVSVSVTRLTKNLLAVRSYQGVKVGSEITRRAIRRGKRDALLHKR